MKVQYFPDTRSLVIRFSDQPSAMPSFLDPWAIRPSAYRRTYGALASRQGVRHYSSIRTTPLSSSRFQGFG